MGGFLLHGCASAKAGTGVNKLVRAKGGAAFLALVAVCVRVTALGAGSNNQSVREEHFGFLVVELFALFRDEIAMVVELAEELRSILFVHLRRCAGVYVEVDSKARERVFHHLMVFIHYILRGNSLLARLDGDGHAVLVASANEQDILPAHAQIAHINVSGDICTCKVADVNRPVCIRQRTGYQGSLVFILHISAFVFPVRAVCSLSVLLRSHG